MPIGCWHCWGRIAWSLTLNIAGVEHLVLDTLGCWDQLDDRPSNVSYYIMFTTCASAKISHPNPTS